MQLCYTLLYSRMGCRSNFSDTPLLTRPRKFSLKTSSVVFLKSSSLAVNTFLLFLICACSLVLQSFKMDFGEESEVEVSSHDGEG